MKSLLLNVTPIEALNILNGKQLALLRKRVPKGFKGWCYLWVSNGLCLYEYEGKYFLGEGKSNRVISSFPTNLINRTIPCRFWFDEYKFFDSNYEDFVYSVGGDFPRSYEKNWLSIEKFKQLAINQGCITEEELWNYFESGVNDIGYAMHIKNLQIFDEPKELSEFVHGIKYITKAPQSYMYVEVIEE